MIAAFLLNSSMNKPDYTARKISSSITIDGNINKALLDKRIVEQTFWRHSDREAGMYNYCKQQYCGMTTICI